jgi:hypothetical protein
MRKRKTRRGEIAGWELVGLALVILCGATFFYIQQRDAGYRECSQCGGDGYVDQKDIHRALKLGLPEAFGWKEGYCLECQPLKALQARTDATPGSPCYRAPAAALLPFPGSQPPPTSGLRAGSQAPRDRSWQRQAAQKQVAWSRYVRQAQRDSLKHYVPIEPARTPPPDWIPKGQTSGGWRYTGRSGRYDNWRWVDSTGRTVGLTICGSPSQ